MIKRILQTDLLYTMCGDPIENGRLAIDANNKIAAIGTNLEAIGVDVEYFEGALCPGFINTHCHLELSHLKAKVPQNTGLNGFIQDLQKLRAATEGEVQQAISKADVQMKKEGIVAVGDISNGGSTFSTKVNSSIYYHTFIELFAFDPSQASQMLERGNELNQQAKALKLSASIVPHSPYSVSKTLFELIATCSENFPLSIHNQETAAENHMYQQGEGKLVEMLKGFGLDFSSFNVSGKSSLLSYLDYLPKDQNLLLVHNTFTQLHDIQVAESMHKNLYWCFCPKANLYIENCLPELSHFVKEGVKCTLGTDSLASNNSLSIWEEIQTIQQHFPTMSMNTLLQWATINGAEFLGIEEEYGSFEVAKQAAVNWMDKEGRCVAINMS